MNEQEGLTPEPESGAAAQQVDTQTTDTGQEPAPKTADPAAKPDKPKRDGGFQRRINELTYQVREGQRQNQQLIDLMRDQQSRSQGDDKPPTPDQFGTLAEYTNAQIDYALKKAGVSSHKDKRDGQDQRGSGRSDKAEQPDPAFAASIEDMISEGSEKYEDFEDKMDVAKYITPVMARAITESEYAADVAYHLFNDQKEARRIANLPPQRQFMEIGKLEAKLEGKPSPKKPSSAPAPVSPVNGNSAASTEPKDSDDIDTWVRKERARMKGR